MFKKIFSTLIATVFVSMVGISSAFAITVYNASGSVTEYMDIAQFGGDKTIQVEEPTSGNFADNGILQFS